MQYSHKNVTYIITRDGGQEGDNLINLKSDQRAVKLRAPRARKTVTKTMAKLVVAIKTGGSVSQVFVFWANSLKKIPVAKDCVWTVE